LTVDNLWISAGSRAADFTFVLHFSTGARASFLYFILPLALAQESAVVLKQQKSVAKKQQFFS